MVNSSLAEGRLLPLARGACALAPWCRICPSIVTVLSGLLQGLEELLIAPSSFAHVGVVPHSRAGNEILLQ